MKVFLPETSKWKIGSGLRRRFKGSNTISDHTYKDTVQQCITFINNYISAVLVRTVLLILLNLITGHNTSIISTRICKVTPRHRFRSECSQGESLICKSTPVYPWDIYSSYLVMSFLSCYPSRTALCLFLWPCQFVTLVFLSWPPACFLPSYISFRLFSSELFHFF